MDSSIHSDLRPVHLLRYEGDSQLEYFYRSLVIGSCNNRNRNTEVHDDPHHCDACGKVLSTDDRVRLKPSLRVTRNIQKLLNKNAKKRPLSRYENFKLKKFMENSQQMVIKCSACQQVNKKTLLDREELVKLKNQKLIEVQETDSTEVKKKKRKKKKKKKYSNPNSVLTDDEGDDKTEDASLPVTPATPQTPSSSQSRNTASLRQFVGSKVSNSSMFESAIGLTHLPNSKTPLTSRPSMKLTNKTPGTTFQTPSVFRLAPKLPKHTPRLSSSQPLAKSAPAVSKKKSALMQKQLKQYLIQRPQEPEKKSLKDFLDLLQ